MGLPSITRFHFRSLINFTPCGLCRSSLFLSFWLLSSLCRGSVQNLSCDSEQSEGFSPRLSSASPPEGGRGAEVTRQAGMTYINVSQGVLCSILIPCHQLCIRNSR